MGRTRRAVTLYFASIGARQALSMTSALLTSPISRASRRRDLLHAEIRRTTGAPAAFSYASARGALAACLDAARIGKGDDVLVSSYTCLAVPTAVLAAGARPVYSDIDPRTMNVTPALVAAAITPKTRAIVVQHTLGSAAPVDEIVAFAKSRNILVIEDCALSIGTTVNGVPVGTRGDAAIFSLELSKTLSVGWGGILTVRSQVLATQVAERYLAVPELSSGRAARMAIQTAASGLSYNPSLYAIGKYAVYFGFKYGVFGPSTPPAEFDGVTAPDFIAKLPGAQASLALQQWRRRAQVFSACAGNASRVREILDACGHVPLGSPDEATVAVTPRVAFLVANRPAIIEWFQREGIDLGSWFDGPLSPLPKAEAFNYDRTRYPNASFVADHVVNIPCHGRLSEADLAAIDRVMGAYAAAHPEDSGLQQQLLDSATSFTGTPEAEGSAR